MIKPLFPFTYHSRKRLFSNNLFWILLFITALPFLTVFSVEPEKILYFFSLYICLIWMAVFISFFAKKNDKFIPIISGMLFCALISFPITQLLTTFLSKLYPSTISTQASIKTFCIQFFAIAFKEEFFKLIPIIIFAYYSFHISDPIDAMIIGLGSGLGFAAFENLLYIENLNRQLTTNDISFYSFLFKTLTRIITLPYLHAVFTGIAGYYIGVYKCKPQKSKWLLVAAIGIPALLHHLYNFSVINYIGGTIVVLIISHIIFMNIYLKETA